jgi:hypothetical protein
MALALCLKTLDMVSTKRHRNAQMNGDNPVVRAIQEESRINRADAAEREARKAAALAAHDEACRQRMRDHNQDVRAIVADALARGHSVQP